MLEEDEEGGPWRPSSPIFYLPEQDLYVEVTVMKQSLVTRKNRKLRKLRERYPRCASSCSTSGTSSAWPSGTGSSSRRSGHPLASDTQLGEVYLSRDEPPEARTQSWGREIARDYSGLEPLLVAPLKASLVFAADLSRAIDIVHGLDFLELASYAAGADTGGHARIRLLKDLDTELVDRHVLIVEDVVDTGLTLNYLCKTLSLREPRRWRR